MTESALDLLDRYRAAMMMFSADELADLYAADGVHEFPFRTHDGVTRLEGREQVRSYYRRLWAEPPVTLDRIDNRALHQVAPDTIIYEWSGTGRHRNPDVDAVFELSGVIVMTARNGLIASLRDYMDVYGLLSQTASRAGLDQLE